MTQKISKSGLINNFVRWTIVVSAFTISLALVISWLLWVTMYSSKIANALKFFGQKTLAQGYGIKFDFLVLSIGTLAVVALAFLFALPLVFYRKKSGFTVFVSLFNFILATTIIVATVLFVMTSYTAYADFYKANGLKVLLIIFLPWVITLFFTLFLFFASLWSLISAAGGITFVLSAETIKQAQPTGPQEVSSLPLEQTTIMAGDEIVVPQPTATYNQSHHQATEQEIISPQPSNFNSDNAQPPSQDINAYVPPSKGPFDVYQQNERGEYVMLKDQYHPGQEESEIIGEDQKIKYEGIRTPKIEEMTPDIANPDKLAPESKGKIKPITSWSKQQINEVWKKGQVIKGVSPALYRKDYAGAWMFCDAFTNTLEEVSVRSYAWTIVNHRPLSQGGDNEIANLDPMNVTNAITKGENYPKWKTKISSSGNENIVKEQSWKARV